MQNESSVDGALALIEELRVDAKLGKGKHLAAAERKLRWHRVCGIAVILANLLVGIVLLSIQGQAASTRAAAALAMPAAQTVTPAVTSNVSDTAAAPGTPGSAPVAATAATPVAAPMASAASLSTRDAFVFVAVILAFMAASLSGVQTFFNFYKSVEGHRAIANRYTRLSWHCKKFQQKHRDLPYEAGVLWEEYEKVMTEYNQINTDGEAFPSNANDLKKARSAPALSLYTSPRLE